MLEYQALRGFTAWNTFTDPDNLDEFDFYELNSYNSGFFRLPYVDEDNFYSQVLDRFDSNNDY